MDRYACLKGRPIFFFAYICLRVAVRAKGRGRRCIEFGSRFFFLVFFFFMAEDDGRLSFLLRWRLYMNICSYITSIYLCREREREVYLYKCLYILNGMGKLFLQSRGRGWCASCLTAPILVSFFFCSFLFFLYQKQLRLLHSTSSPLYYYYYYLSRQRRRKWPPVLAAFLPSPNRQANHSFFLLFF